MASQAQNRANRQNAKKSTGPRSAEGKALVATNALRHGGYASQAAAIPRGFFAEDPDEVKAFVDRIVASLGPTDDLETAQANRIAVHFLRLRRLNRLEAEALAADSRPLPETERLLLQDGADPDLYGREEAAKRVLSSTFERASRIDARVGRALERALVLYNALQRRGSEGNRAQFAVAELAEQTQSATQA